MGLQWKAPVLYSLCALLDPYLTTLGGCVVGRNKWKLPEKTWTKPRRKCSAYPKKRRRGQGLGMRFPVGLVEAATVAVRRSKPLRGWGLVSVSVFVEPGPRLKGQITLLSLPPIIPAALLLPPAAVLLGNGFPGQHLGLGLLKLQLLLQFLPLSLSQYPFQPQIQ